jgi:putative peptide zinc metalloprotease protein
MTIHRSARYSDLSLVADGDGFIIGSPHSTDFLAVPQIGGLVVQWLQDGHDVDQCATLAEQHTGQTVDIVGFLDRLTAEGLLPDARDPGPPSSGNANRVDRHQSPPGQRLGRILYGRTGLTVQLGLAAAGLPVLITHPDLRPTYTDAIVTDIALASLLIGVLMTVAGGLLHEAAHALAAASKGVRSKITISRRLYTIVYQTDLTQLWRLPRRDRLLPLSAGMLLDAAVAGLVLLLLAGPWQNTHPLLIDIARAVVLTKLAGIFFQAEVFMRTDIYAILASVTGCHNLWVTKNAVARRLIRRATPQDLIHLASVTSREIRCASVYLALYIPGVAWATWYLVTFALPALWALLAMSITAVTLHGITHPLGIAGALSAALVVIPTTAVLTGAIRSTTRGLQTLHPPSKS